MKNKLPLTALEAENARMLYLAFFTQVPHQKNPTDINTVEKYNFMQAVGWTGLNLMQRARKGNIAKYGYPYPWTKR